MDEGKKRVRKKGQRGLLCSHPQPEKAIFRSI
jgi:hypothetical protein